MGCCSRWVCGSGISTSKKRTGTAYDVPPRVVLLLIPEERGLQVQPMEESSASDPLSAQRILSWRTITAVVSHVVQNLI
jgi:hypothetical protein